MNNFADFSLKACLVECLAAMGINQFVDLKITKNASSEWFSWPQPPGQPLFVGLIIKNPIFL